MIIAKFDSGCSITSAYGLWQYDYGQLLDIQGLDVRDGTAIHFAQNGKTIESTVRSNQVEIPDYFLQFDGEIEGYVYTEGDGEGQTIAKIKLPIHSRDRPPDYVTPEEPSYTRLLPKGWDNEDFLTVKNGKLTWVKLTDEFATDRELAEVAETVPQFASMKEIEAILNKEV